MRLALAASLVASLALAENGQLTLEGTTDSLEVVTTTTAAIDYHLSWSNVTATALTTPGTGNGQITTATTTTLLAAPAASNWRYIRAVHLTNVSTTTANTLTIQVDRSTANRVLCRVTLAPGENLDLEASGACVPYDVNGRMKVATAEVSGISGRTFEYSKGATAIDTIGYHYLANKDNGFPGAWSVGTPGVNGVVTACDVVGTAGTGGALSLGAPLLPDPASGSYYLTRFGLNAAVANTYQLLDILWYDTGLSPTTTTAQAIVTPAFPARDRNGSANGEGLKIALYALTALGNAAAIANTTVSYTNSDGTAGRTATFSALVGRQAPATPVIGTWMPFELAAGDRGVRAIASITLATTYTSGTMMLVVYRPIANEGVPVANFPSGSLVARPMLNPGIRIYNDTCFAVATLGGIAVTAPTITSGIIELMER